MSDRRNWRIVLLPVIVCLIAAAIWIANRPTAKQPGPVVRPADPAWCASELKKGRELLEKAVQSSGPGEIEALDARRHFLNAVTADGDNLDAREWCARCEAFLGMMLLQQAQNNLDYALKLDPKRTSARELRAQVRWRIAFGTDGHVLPRRFGRWKTTRDPVAPKESAGLRKLADEDFQATGAYWGLRVAEEHFRAGRLDEAQGLATASDPRMPETSVMLALIALERGQDASMILTAPLQRKFAPAAMLVARLAVEAGEWQKAYDAAHILTDFDLTAKWVDAWLYQGIAAKRLGKTKEAGQALDYAKALDPTVAEWIPKD